MTARYHGVYKKPYIKEEQTIQWPQDTIGFIRSVYQRRTDNTMTTRYHRVYKKSYIKEGQTTQWSQDTIGFIRSRISKDRQHNDHKIPRGL